MFAIRNNSQILRWCTGLINKQNGGLSLYGAAMKQPIRGSGPIILIPAVP